MGLDQEQFTQNVKPFVLPPVKRFEEEPDPPKHEHCSGYSIYGHICCGCGTHPELND